MTSIAQIASPRNEGSEQGARESAQTADEPPPGEWEWRAANEGREEDKCEGIREWEQTR